MNGSETGFTGKCWRRSASATADRRIGDGAQAESYLIFDRESGGRGFSTRERDLLAFFLRGSTLLHRELLQMHGLLNASRPLSPRERVCCACR